MGSRDAFLDLLHGMVRVLEFEHLSADDEDVRTEAAVLCDCLFDSIDTVGDDG